MADIDFEYKDENDLVELYIKLRDVATTWLKNHKNYAYDFNINQDKRIITIKIQRCN